MGGRSDEEKGRALRIKRPLDKVTAQRASPPFHPSNVQLNRLQAKHGGTLARQWCSLSKLLEAWLSQILLLISCGRKKMSSSSSEFGPRWLCCALRQPPESLYHRTRDLSAGEVSNRSSLAQIHRRFQI
ncbi:uncharacterized protein ACIBXB_008309 [Morphnus guianensis]